MSKKIKRLVSLLLAALMLASVPIFAVACGKKEKDPSYGADGKDYTYKSYTTALGSNWNPHTWDTNADQTMLGYVSSPFVDMSILDSENGVYQWVYEMAASVTDVTRENTTDLEKYPVNLPEGQTAAEQTEGYVFEIKLNPDAKWENGEAIKADDYIESFKRLLDPSMKNYRANLYYNGESAVAGGSEYYFSKDAGIYNGVYTEYESIDAALAAGETVYLDMHGFYGLAGAKDEAGNECPQWVSVTDETKYLDPEDSSWVSAADIYEKYGASLVNGGGYEAYVSVYRVNDSFGAGWDVVGLYKVDDDTLRYVNDTYIGYNYFMTSLTSNWLVYVPLYDELKNTTGELVTTKYGTSKETTMSYGTYRMASLEEDKQVIYVRNENWYGWEKDENGNLYSLTSFEVDGEKRQQYKTTGIVITVMDEAAAKLAFLKGELTEWTPAADELSTYSLSEQLYKVDETYTLSFFFNTDPEALKVMDRSKGNTNSVVLSNKTFRKAFSLAIDRARFVTATQAYKPSFSLMNSLYYYDIYDDDKDDGVEGANTNYRNTEEAMQAIVNLYGVEYGEGKAYATLKEAHDSITGYNLTEAKKLMKEACDQLVADGIYTAGQPIRIRIGWSKGALTADDRKQLTLINEFITAAAQGSGFGTITLEAVGNIDNRYADVPAGEYAIGYGAWGGAAFYPFRNFQVYMDPDQYAINEAANYDPKTDTVTLTVDGREVTKTWQAWSQSMMGTGDYAAASNKIKLQITAQLEQKFLETYYRIPLCATTVCSMLSFQCNYYTDEYNIMYGFGGMRLMNYNYDDAAWATYVAQQVAENGQLDYQ